MSLLSYLNFVFVFHLPFLLIFSCNVLCTHEMKSTNAKSNIHWRDWRFKWAQCYSLLQGRFSSDKWSQFSKLCNALTNEMVILKINMIMRPTNTIYWLQSHHRVCPVIHMHSHDIPKVLHWVVVAPSTQWVFFTFTHF